MYEGGTLVYMLGSVIMSMDFEIWSLNGVNVRYVTYGTTPWFVLKDLCAAFGVIGYRNVAKRLNQDQKGLFSVQTPRGGIQKMTFANDFGLADLIARSRTPEAEALRWRIMKG